jgi:hypothetical protein
MLHDLLIFLRKQGAARGFSERQRKTREDDDNDRYDLGYRALDGFLVEWLLPRHVRSSRMGR